MKVSKAELIEVIKKEVDQKIDFDNLDPEVAMTDQGIDSLDRTSIFLAIEDEYDLQFSDDEIDNFKTLKDIIDYLNNK